MFRAVVVFCAVLTLANGQTTQVSNCTSNAGALPLNAHIEGCVTPPCHLPQLQDAVINIIFEAPRIIQEMRTLATAYLSGFIPLPVPYPLGANAVTCNFLTNTYCPLVQGEVVQYTLNMYIDAFMPVDTQASIEFRIVEAGNNAPLMCIRVPIRITPAVSSKLGA